MALWTPDLLAASCEINSRRSPEGVNLGDSALERCGVRHVACVACFGHPQSSHLVSKQQPQCCSYIKAAPRWEEQLSNHLQVVKQLQTASNASLPEHREQNLCAAVIFTAPLRQGEMRQLHGCQAAKCRTGLPDQELCHVALPLSTVSTPCSGNAPAPAVQSSPGQAAGEARPPSPAPSLQQIYKKIGI